ncbi:MAG TPA: MerR family transcriptional regulator [Fimbriimonadaceae bacterium]|mgnify:CR=1 FL=1|nr:MerR family transcriptional regulator [Fimbriimonadaceae bacterium]
MLSAQDEGLSQVLVEERVRAPYSIDELLDAVNRILALGQQSPVTVRTLRFYIGQGVVARPIGSPKFARYGYEHLLMLLGARMLQDRGSKLDAIATEVQEIRRGRFDRYEQMIAEWLQQRAPRAAPFVRESPAHYEASPSPAMLGHAVTRIKISPNTTVEVALGSDLADELTRAAEALQNLADSAKKPR